MITGFDDAVKGLKQGDAKTVRVRSDEAYRPYDASLRTEVDRVLFAAEGVDPKVGMELDVRSETGKTVAVRITDIADTRITLDANHPLAGKDLIRQVPRPRSHRSEDAS